MTITYRLDDSPALDVARVDSFDSFAEWMWSMEVGRDRDDERINRYWYDTYFDLRTKPLHNEMRLPRYRDDGIGKLAIVEVMN